MVGALTVTRPRLLPLFAIGFTATSALLTIVGGAQQPCLLIAQLIGTTGLALLGVEFVRRPPLRVVGWIVLALAAATYVVLAETAVRVLSPLASG